MLELKNIKKQYVTGDLTVEALKGISLSFRKSEFVSILGPSGCGKTTMLNIIGGLDKYNEGDLIINGVSTKDYSDRDWDSYRNHSVGFVFQNYNLIPHQTVLQNVELALTLSGVSKQQRRKKAIEALNSVGLGNQLKKKPNEMSGGQMQRVAIARAIVNDPDIILADEPTGALDSTTSVAVMDILKEISKTKLVIMVTHNPELANKYSTRIVNMLDGIITSDSNAPATEELEINEEKIKNAKKDKKPSMSLSTSFSLSLKNLINKKGRTILTSFAGSIGIIGIALIFAVSNGMTTFINTVQKDTLSSYPLMLETQHTDLGSMMETFMSGAVSHDQHEMDGVYQKSALYDMVNAMNSLEQRENDLRSFKLYLEAKRNDKTEENKINKAISGVKYTYNHEMLIYTKNVDGKIIASNTEELMSEILIKFMKSMNNVEIESDSNGINNMFSSANTMQGLWTELLSGDNGTPINDMLYKQYDLIYGSWPNSYNEIVLIVDKNNEIDDMTLYALGLKSRADIDKIVDSAINKTELEFEAKKWSFEEICNMEFKTILNSDCYILDENSNLYTDLRKTDAGLKYLYDKGISLKVTGIIKPNEDAVASMLDGHSIAYTNLLTEYIVKESEDSVAIKEQLNNPTIDIFSGLPFEENTGNMTDQEKETEFKEYINSISKEEKANAYIKIKSIPSNDSVENYVTQSMNGLTREIMESTLTNALSSEMQLNVDEIKEYISSMTDQEISDLFKEMITEQYKVQYAQNVSRSLKNMSSSQLSKALTSEIDSFTTEQCATYHDEVLIFSDSTLENNLYKLGYIDFERPSTINLYASSFENKDVIEEIISDYNDKVAELSKITYTDYVGIMMSSVVTIINAITYVLIAFVAVSLIVSSIMIGVITLISVQERTKEIGILRSIGASKKNVSTMFNAETVIIGFASGLVGIIITYILCIPINAILHYFTGINNLSAVLPLPIAIILICISVLLTLLAGIIPSMSAAKKDPVIALRTE